MNRNSFQSDIGRVPLLALTIGALGVVACISGDPGWLYSAPNGKAVQSEGLRYELPEASGIRSLAYGSVFAGTLTVEVDIQNSGSTPLQIDLDGLFVHDAKGQLAKRRPGSSRPRCGGELSGARCILGLGQSCRLSWTFQVRPLVRSLGFLRPNPDLRELSISVPSARRDGNEKGINISMTKR
jgi:hypothetical protein